MMDDVRNDDDVPKKFVRVEESFDNKGGPRDSLCELNRVMKTMCEILL